MKQIVCILGVTCSGKTTLIKECISRLPKTRMCLIGQKLREKYPPEFFKGKAALPETEAEVKQILMQAVEEFAGSDDQLLLIDGAPRLPECLTLCEQINWSVFPVSYLFVTCDEAVTNQRSRNRDGNDPQKLQLSQKRLVGDKVMAYDVLVEMLRYKGIASRLYCITSTNGFTDDTYNFIANTFCRSNQTVRSNAASHCAIGDGHCPEVTG